MENRIENLFDPSTLSVLKEIRLNPDAKVYRWLHPVMVHKQLGNFLYLRGNHFNGTAVMDYYQNPAIRRRASALPQPGLNFTRGLSRNYVNSGRRLCVSLQMVEQPSGLKVYSDQGSEVPSVYFTLPEDNFFKVRAEEFDQEDISLGVKIHDLMTQLNWQEEPYLYNYIHTKGDGFRVVQDEKGKKVETIFKPAGENTLIVVDIQNQNSLKLDSVEEVSVLRILLDEKKYNKVIGVSGIEYFRNELTK